MTEEEAGKQEKENAELKDQMAKKDQRIEELEAHLMRTLLRIEELERRLGKDSHNSSKPPSSDGLGRKPGKQRPGDLSTVVYDILQAAVTVIWCISMVILFIDVIIIRHKYHDTFARTLLAPDWVFYLCSILGLVASAFGVYVTFTGPWTTLVSYSQWLFWIGGIGILSLIVGIILFFIGQSTIKKDVSDEEIIAQVTT